MGAKNLDRIPFHMWRARVESVADMKRDGWDVISSCHKCGLLMAVDLDLMAKVSGPETSLWNRKARCRRLGCTGVVEFQGKPPKLYQHQVLEAPWPENRPPKGEA